MRCNNLDARGEKEHGFSKKNRTLYAPIFAHKDVIDVRLKKEQKKPRICLDGLLYKQTARQDLLRLNGL